jgi:fibronectin-binding autotransporter adhesin
VTLTDGEIADGTLGAACFDVYNGGISADLAGSAALSKRGTGTVTLSGTNDYTGGTSVYAGTLVIAVAGALPTGDNPTIYGGSIIYE